MKTPATPDLPVRPPEQTTSVAVLPFVNMSANADTEYFSDGMTEEIINALTKIKNLKVTSRTSSFFFKNKNIPIPQIGRELHVSTILEGSVRLETFQSKVADPALQHLTLLGLAYESGFNSKTVFNTYFKKNDRPIAKGVLEESGEIRRSDLQTGMTGTAAAPTFVPSKKTKNDVHNESSSLCQIRRPRSTPNQNGSQAQPERQRNPDKNPCHGGHVSG